MKGKKAAKSIIYNAIILAIGLIMIYPLVWMIMSSFKETNIIFKTAGQLIPKMSRFAQNVTELRAKRN